MASNTPSPALVGLVSRTNRRLLAVVWIGFVLAIVALGIWASRATTMPGDVAVSQWVQAFRASWLDSLMKAVAFAGDPLPAAGILAIVAGIVALAGRRFEAALIGGATVLAFVVRTLLKEAVQRPRPAADLVEIVEEADGYSFPSGHVLHYAVFLGLLLIVLPMVVRPGFGLNLARALLVGLIVLCGVSRVYLGVHWFSDVVAAYAIAAALVVAALWVWWLRNSVPSEPSSPALRERNSSPSALC